MKMYKITLIKSKTSIDVYYRKDADRAREIYDWLKASWPKANVEMETTDYADIR